MIQNNCNLNKLVRILLGHRRRRINARPSSPKNKHLNLHDSNNKWMTKPIGKKNWRNRSNSKKRILKSNSSKNCVKSRSWDTTNMSGILSIKIVHDMKFLSVRPNVTAPIIVPLRVNKKFLGSSRKEF